MPQLRDAPARRVAVVARVAHRLDQLLDRDVGRRDVGVAEAEVDDVLAGAPGLDLQRVHDPEDVRRQRVDPAELHSHKGSAACLSASGGYQRPSAQPGQNLLAQDPRVVGIRGVDRARSSAIRRRRRRRPRSAAATSSGPPTITWSPAPSRSALAAAAASSSAEHDEATPRHRERRARAAAARRLAACVAEPLEPGAPAVPAVGVRGRDLAHRGIACRRPTPGSRGRAPRRPRRAARRPVRPPCRTRARRSRSPRGSRRRRRRSRRAAVRGRGCAPACRSRCASVADGRSVARATSEPDRDRADVARATAPINANISSAGRRLPARRAGTGGRRRTRRRARAPRPRRPPRATVPTSSRNDGKRDADLAPSRVTPAPAPAPRRRRRRRDRPSAAAHDRDRRAGTPRPRCRPANAARNGSSSTSPSSTRPPDTTMSSGSRMFTSPTSPTRHVPRRTRRRARSRVGSPACAASPTWTPVTASTSPPASASTDGRAPRGRPGPAHARRARSPTRSPPSGPAGRTRTAGPSGSTWKCPISAPKPCAPRSTSPRVTMPPPTPVPSVIEQHLALPRAPRRG